MMLIKKYSLFLESKNNNKKNIVRDLCVAMVLLNNEFLDNILDRGIKGRYNENSYIFLTDLKNLLLAKNRLKIGKYENDIWKEDNNIAVANTIFNNATFDIDKNWTDLVNARLIARGIIDKLLPDRKLKSDDIKSVYWNINEDLGQMGDIILETTDDKQYSFYLNKNLNTQKSASFNLFMDDLIGENVDKLYTEYLPKWNKLTSEWIKLIYENSHKNIQKHIEKFIDPKRIDTIGYFGYFDIKHMDPRYKYLGEHIKEFNKNILKFSDLISEIWKNRDICLLDPERIFKEWMETKIIILNSRILENLITNSIKTNHPEDIKKIDDNWKLASGEVKMKLFKTLVEKLGCVENSIIHISKNGEIFNLLPSRKFFRKYYDDITMKFDYHVNFIVSEDEESNDFKIKIKLELDNDTLIDMFITIKFSSEMSGRLTVKYKFVLADNFNHIITKKEIEQ